MAADHIKNFEDNVDDVGQLMGIHRILSGSGPGRRSKMEVLNKSGIVLLVACWESYVEELLTAAFDYMVKNSENHMVFPAKVLTLASNDLREDDNKAKVWDLAGKGWITVLQDHKQKILDTRIGNFNTPSTENIDQMFEEMIGLKMISKEWYWRGMSVTNARNKLQILIKLRGDIAHKVSSDSGVRKKQVVDFAEFIHRLAVICNNRVANYVKRQVGGPLPWTRFNYGFVR